MQASWLRRGLALGGLALALLGAPPAAAQDPPEEEIFTPCKMTSLGITAWQLASGERDDAGGQSFPDRTCDKAYDRHDVIQLFRTKRCQGCALSGANLSELDLGDSIQLRSAYLNGADLRRAILIDARLQRARLADADLRSADLRSAILNHASLLQADLTRAKLGFASLKYAALRSANLNRANLRSAILVGADLRESTIFRSDLTDVDLTGADVGGALYSPIAAGDRTPESVAGVVGLDELVTTADMNGLANVAGMVLLATDLQRLGLRGLERRVRHSVETNRTWHLIRERYRSEEQTTTVGAADAHTRAGIPYSLDVRNVPSLIEWLGRVVLLDLTVSYGLYPGRAVMILLGLAVFMTFPYAFFIWFRDERPDRRSGIYRIWPNERIVHDGEEPRLVTYDDEHVKPERRIERLRVECLLGVYWHAFYFSLLSAFRIGFRELNLGTWVSWLQASDYTLRARGVPRVLSGVQSIISLYLVAMALLTYFGRPFQ